MIVDSSVGARVISSLPEGSMCGPVLTSSGEGQSSGVNLAMFWGPG